MMIEWLPIILLFIVVMYIDHNNPLGMGGLLPSWLCIFCHYEDIRDALQRVFR